MVHSLRSGMQVCEIIQTNQCTEYNEEESLYCCEYVTQYQNIYLHLIKIIAYMDMGDLIISTLALFIALIIFKFKIGPPGSGIYIMAGSTALTAIITFSLVGLIRANGLMATAQELYDHGCYGRPHMGLITELKNEFASIIWVDALNGSIDVLALCILFYGIKCQQSSDSGSFALPTKTVYVVLYLMRMLVSYVSYFKAELPAYLHFLDVHDDRDALCYKVIKLHINHHHLIEQSVL